MERKCFGAGEATKHFLPDCFFGRRAAKHGSMARNRFPGPS
jgi:hypothetical protein